MPILSPRALAFLAGASHRLGVDLLLVAAPDEVPEDALCAVDISPRGRGAASLVAMGASSCIPSAAVRVQLEVIGDALVHLVEAEREVRLHAAVAHREAAAQSQSQRRADEVEAASLRDELTGVANRRGFLVAARAHHARASQESRPFLLLFADLDGLKPINDRQGHAAGDEAIRQVASILVATLRTGDVVSRLAGDEFVVLAKDVGRESAVMLRARLLEAFETARPQAPAEARLQVSVGFAAFVPGSGETLEALLARADAAMYFEKKRRRLRASAAGTDAPAA